MIAARVADFRAVFLDLPDVAEKLIAAGRVRVDGELATLGRRIDLQTARVEVDGSLVPVAPDLVYYLLNKPDGIITTADDPQGRPTVMTLVPAEPRVFAVGRLDRHGGAEARHPPGQAFQGLEVFVGAIIAVGQDGAKRQRIAPPGSTVRTEVAWLALMR